MFIIVIYDIDDIVSSFLDKRNNKQCNQIKNITMQNNNGQDCSLNTYCHI